MALILAVDTSAKSVSCALARDDHILASYFTHTGLTHSQTLMPMIESVLDMANVTMKDVDALAVNAGPGSFTGVRIGVSAVKGLAFTNGLPCVAVSTLECMAENVAVTPEVIICCLMDARCQQVYAALFERDQMGIITRLTEDEALTIPNMLEKLKQYKRPVVLVGDGSAMCFEIWKKDLPDLSLAPPSVRLQNAAATSIIAGKYYRNRKFVSHEELQPVYLRLPQAERELMARKNLK